MTKNYTQQLFLSIALWLVASYTSNLRAQSCNSEERMTKTNEYIWMGQDEVNNTIYGNYPLTNTNLKKRGTTINILLKANNVAGGNNETTATLTISFAGVTYATFTIPKGKNPSSVTSKALNNATILPSNIPIVSSTSNQGVTNLAITLPNTIPNEGNLVYTFNSGRTSGDFTVSNTSFKACPVIFSGKVLNDANGNVDNKVNSTGTVPIPNNLYVNLINNTTNTIVASSPVSPQDGSFSISTAGSIEQPRNGYNLILVNNNNALSPIPPNGYSFVGQSYTNGGPSTASSGTGLLIPTFSGPDQFFYFGIDANPMAMTVNKGPLFPSQFPLTDIPDYRGILSSDPNTSILSGFDLEDGTLGIGNDFKIIGITSGTKLYYGTTELKPNSIISNYKPDLLRIYGIGTSSSVSFSYATIDKAVIESSPVFYTISSAFSLPIKLNNFAGNAEKNQVYLHWKSGVEINFDYFEIQRSPDGIAFSTIGKVFGKGNDNDYNFKYIASTPTEFVRLKMVDKDGTYTISNVLSINNKSEATTPTVFPNPFTSSLNLKNMGSEIKTIQLSNSQGTIVYTKQTNQQQISINSQSLTSGIYIVFIKFNNGKTFSTKVLKQ